jgi:hypothetical protein
MVSDNHLVISAYSVLTRASVPRAVLRCVMQENVSSFIFLFCYYLDQQMHNILIVMSVP